MNTLLARIVMIAKQTMSDFISKNPARNSAAMVPPLFSGTDLNMFPLHRRHDPLHRRCVAILRFIMNGLRDES
jgi:hypothetical protein